MEKEYFSGKGAQINTSIPFSSTEYCTDHVEGLDEAFLVKPTTQVFHEHSKKVVNKVDSPDLGMMYSLNPYQGCEHGCIYCYARNSHQYWGFSAGLDFESKIIVKENAPHLLTKQFLNGNWKPAAIALSGNTDCYQPLERKYQLTRQLLKVFAQYGNPVNIITKNSLILRDIDILKKLAKEGLVHVNLSVTTLDEGIRRIMEPRTASARNRLKTIAALTEAGIPVSVMVAPIIPGLNNYEIPSIIKECAGAGALSAGYTIVRLNGSIGEIFKDWLYKNFPDRGDKVWHQVCALHGGKVNDSEWGRRMKGEGKIAESIAQLFKSARKKYMGGREVPSFNFNAFRRNGNYNLFG